MQLDGTGSSDPDSDPISYQWSQTGGALVTLDSNTSATPSFTAPTGLTATESLTFNLIVNDGTDNSVADSVVITVNLNVDNTPPTANAGPDQTVDAGTVVSLDGSGSTDSDGTITDYSWIQTTGPTVPLTDVTTATATFTAPTISGGTQITLELMVTDNNGATATDTVDIVVQNGVPPVLFAGASPVNQSVYPIAGTAGADRPVNLYLNGLYVETVTADSTGAYTFNVMLTEGAIGVDETTPSNQRTIELDSTLVLEPLSGPVSDSTILIVPTTIYEVTGTITIPLGETLTIPAGTQIRFANATQLVVDGTLAINGTATEKVRLTTINNIGSSGNWSGISVASSATNVLIENALIEYASIGIRFNNYNALATISNSELRYNNRGIDFQGQGAGMDVQVNNNDLHDNTSGIVAYSSTRWALTDNEVHHNTNSGVYLERSSPPVTNNYIHDNGTGVYANLTSTSVITGNEITLNGTGIHARGGNSVQVSDPRLVVTGNSIYGNTSWNYYTERYYIGQGAVLDATGNWWGSADPVVISNSIRDYTDTTLQTPIIDFGGFLDGPGGTPVVGDYLSTIIDNVVLTAGVTYTAIGDVVVKAGGSLTIPAGTRIEFPMDNEFWIDGELIVQGTAIDPVVITSGQAIPATADWQGLRIRSNATNVVIDHAVIEYANIGIHFNQYNALATISNSEIRYSNDGIYFASQGANMDVQLNTNNVHDNVRGVVAGSASFWALTDNEIHNNTGSGVYINIGSPTITGNNIHDNGTGVYSYRTSNPVMTGNEITLNTIGIHARGANSSVVSDPQPVVTGNSIYGNTSWNYYTERYYFNRGAVLNATGNWWGSADPIVISNSIRDYTDTTLQTPIIDFNGFLDGPNGNPAAGNYLFTPPATNQVLSGAVYLLSPQFNVPAGISLTLSEGATVYSLPNIPLTINGTLIVNGSAANPVMFTSSQLIPNRGDWPGIVINSTATAVDINYALIEYANRGVHFNNASGVLRNSVIQHNNYGVYIDGSSNPSLTSNLIYDNNYGIYIVGTGDDATNPQPVIIGNDIYGNTTTQLYVTGYGATSTLILNATGNWWGTPTPVIGTDIVYVNSSPVMDISLAASAPLKGPGLSGVVLTEQYISPGNSPGIKDSTTISGTLSAQTDWVITITDSGGITVKTLSGTGSTLAAAWDGTNASVTLVPDGNYHLVITGTAGGSTGPMGAYTVIVDNTAPTAQIDNSLGGVTIQNLLAVSIPGTAMDDNFQDFSVSYGVGTAPIIYTPIASSLTFQSAGGQLTSWLINSIDGTTFIDSGLYSIQLLVNDRAGNQTIHTIPLTLDNINIGNVSNAMSGFSPLLGETAIINYTLNQAGEVHLRIINPQGTNYVREIVVANAPAGANVITWDGTDDTGQIVPPDAYAYELTAIAGTRTLTYRNTTMTVPALVAPTTYDGSYNTYKNDHWISQITLSANAHFTLRIGPNNGDPALQFFPIVNGYYDQGTHTIVWDGRNASGDIVEGPIQIQYIVAGVNQDALSVQGTQPQITGTAPYIEVKSDPYKIHHSYDQQTRFAFRLDQDAYVTVKLLPPGIADPNHPAAIIMQDETGTPINNRLLPALSGEQPVDHLVHWTGYDDSVAGGSNDIQVSEQGSYTYIIEAVGEVSQISAIFRGVVTMRY